MKPYIYAQVAEVAEDVVPEIAPEITPQDETVTKPRLCSICKKDKCRVNICLHCPTCFKAPGECGFTKGPITNPCGTDLTELASIITRRQEADNKSKRESKKRRGGNVKDVEDLSRVKRRQTE
jgi:hypothetical protein